MTLANERHAVVTDRAPRPVQGAPYSQAIATRGLVFCSGQVPLDPQSGTLVDGGIKEQTTRVFENLKGVLEAAGSSLDDIVKTTVFLTDLANDFGAMNEVYATYFTGAPPARSTFEVSALPAGASVEIECIAVGE
ncbi:MAG: endoribonuclease [Thermoleophilia bacterium]|nr:endoribonuclease [Thermoleophilia bacterium]MCZ4496396.1 endoribonuclease [Thermoleophilia bacterium]